MGMHSSVAIEGFVRAEQHGSDFGVFATIGLARVVPEAELEAALWRCLVLWPSLTFRLVPRGADRTPVSLSLDDVRAFRHSESLASRTISALRGDDSFAYHLPRGGRSLEVLGHHAAMDGDALTAFVTDIDAELTGRPAVGDGTRANTRGDASRRLLPPRSSGRLRDKRRPTPGHWARMPLDGTLTARIDEASRTMRTTPFALLWSVAVAGWPEGTTFGTAVSTRTPGSTRGGNATSIMPVPSAVPTSAPLGPDVIRERFHDVASAWSRAVSVPAPDAGRSVPEVIVSAAAVPASPEWQVVDGVVLGDYVVKYRHHVQFQRSAEGWTVEVHSPAGAEAVLDAFDRRLAAVLGAQVADRGSVRTRDAAVSTTARSPLDEVLAAPRDTQIADLGVDSIASVTLIGDLQERFGVETTLSDFYSWVLVDDLVRHIGGATRAVPVVQQDPSRPDTGSDPARDDGAAVPHPHLGAVFVDAFRLRDSPRYAVEYAFTFPFGMVASTRQLADAVDTVLAANTVFEQVLGFEGGTVVARSGAGAGAVRCEVVDAADIEALRDPAPLRVGRPQRLASVRVGRVAGSVVLVLKFHHLLVDGRAVDLFLEQLTRALRDRPIDAVQYADIAPAVERARAAALTEWTSWQAGWAPLVGRAEFPSGAYERVVVDLGRVDVRTIADAGPESVCRALAAAFGVTRGTLGSVHHGRVVAGSDRVIGSMARVLPIQFDLDDPTLLQRSTALARSAQAATTTDLAPLGFTAFPVVVQVLRTTTQEHDLRVERTDFAALTKFGLFVEIRVGQDTAEMHVAIATDVYSTADRRRIAQAFASTCATTEPESRHLRIVAV